ncbi:hypothetical protein [Shewanella colwelliana]|uniref:hypothetical protein n=1 Tax=Shewanella colwelliana TaxID=23 RepID=UPI0037354819
MKQYMKWIALLIVAIPVIGIVGVPMVMPESSVDVVDDSIVEVSSTLVPGNNSNAEEVGIPVIPRIAEPVVVTVAPPIEMKMVLNESAKTIISKTQKLQEKELDVALEKALAEERGAKQQNIKTSMDDPLGLGRARLLEREDKQLGSPLSQIVLNSLITTNGKTSAYLSTDGIAPVRVIKGSILAGVNVISITENGVTVGFEKETRFLAGGVYD